MSRPRLAAAALALASIASPLTPRLAAQRAPVLQQIKVRHPYYFREMFIPQVTSGPSAVAWSGAGGRVVRRAGGQAGRRADGR